jgi:putative SOS response-associated peptidase YedK
MCGRYVIEWLPDEISERFQLRRIPAFMFESFNAAPTQSLPVIVEQDGGERQLLTMRWGLVPRWAKPGDGKSPAPFNARAESILEKPMFRSLVNRKRCLVPANGYYEWKQIGGRKQPYLFTLKDDQLFAFAGLYDEFQDADGNESASYTIVTTDANEFTAGYHSRMPVILSREDESEWLDRETEDGHAVAHLLQPYPAELMTAHAVSTEVNNVRNNDPHLIEPVDAEQSDSGPQASAARGGRGQQSMF